MQVPFLIDVYTYYVDRKRASRSQRTAAFQLSYPVQATALLDVQLPPFSLFLSFLGLRESTNRNCIFFFFFFH